MPDELPDCLADYASFHAWLTSQEGYRGQVNFYGFLPPRRETEGPPYQGRYATYLETLGIRPYTHQVDALSAVEAGDNVVLATATASGKSLCYQLPSLDALEQGRCALYLFPTKALAHDQLEKLQQLAAQFGHARLVHSYDGDTPTPERQQARNQASCILTNPDMLHYGILPYHGQWAQFLGRLELIVIDELHSYRGVMGTHVGNILRRLLRLAAHYRASPRIIAASATIGNPAAHAESLSGLEFTPVTTETNARASREVIFWRPPELSQNDPNHRRRSPNMEAADLASLFVKTGLKSIVFCNSRKAAELVRRYARGQLTDDEAEQLSSYRAGYTPEDRRALELAFKRGDLRVLTATSALELGVDVGGVDAVVMVGYPGSMSALWQRAGRAGRGDKRALTLLIPGNDPLDEYYLNHPDLIMESTPEDAVADAFNSEIHPLHLACAAAEKPLADGEPIVGRVDPGELPGFFRRGEHWLYQRRYPHRRISVRGTGGKQVALRDGTGKRLGRADMATALRELHPGAVYLHQGENYLVRNLDLERGVAVLLPHLEDYYTQVRSETDIEVLEPESQQRGIHTGRVRVATQVTSYVRKRFIHESVLDERLLDLPELAYPTQALWFSVQHVADAVPPDLLPGAMHALEHTLIGLLPAFVLCERADVGGVSYPRYPDFDEPVIFIYDGYPGGVGYARAGAARFPTWLTAAWELLRDCPCQSGCPRCTLSPKCGNGNQCLDKGAARTLAEALLERLEAYTSEVLEA